MKRVALVILDGVGINDKTVEENALKVAYTPHLDALFETGFYSELQASGEAVGVLDGYMGNSEVGHLTIGSGKIAKQSIVEINSLFRDKEFQKLPAFQEMLTYIKKNSGRLHIIGMLGFAGVHAYQKHFYEFIKLLPSDICVSLHLITDGRDSKVTDSAGYLQEMEDFIKDYPNIKISSLGGRFYAMDRDNNWERIQKFYNATTGTADVSTLSPSEYLQENYKKEIYDEFIEPVCFKGCNFLQSFDACMVINFRPDRARQITQMICGDSIPETIHYSPIPNIFVASMTKFYDSYRGHIFLQKIEFINTLAETLSKNGFTQLHLAETEKFAHVTKYFNGLKTSPWEGEKHILVPSHKVETYELDPEMSAYEIFEEFKNNIGKFDFFVINYANGDMVGHTGSLDAAVKAIETLDKIVGRTIELCNKNDIDLLFIADHGNCESMGLNGEKNTAHTVNPVPCFYVSKGKLVTLKKQGGLSDVAPTVLDIMGITVPAEMTGKSLI